MEDGGPEAAGSMQGAQGGLGALSGADSTRMGSDGRGPHAVTCTMACYLSS